MKKAEVEVVFQVGMVVHNIDEIIKNLKNYFHLEEDSIVIKSTKKKKKSRSGTLHQKKIRITVFLWNSISKQPA